MIQSFNAALILEDGVYFYGRLLGPQDGQQGEICFNTGMTGYQEIISDPSYTNQIVVFSFPHVGNVGVNTEDNESKKTYLNGIILGDFPTAPTNHCHENSFLDWLLKNQVGGIWGIDTRTLIKKISMSKVPIKGKIKHLSKPFSQIELQKILMEFKNTDSLSGSNLSSIVSTKTSYRWDKAEYFSNPISKIKPGFKVGVVDFGVKENILRALISRNCEVQVFPENVCYQTLIDAEIIGIVLSNGPGDPRMVKKQIMKTIQQLIVAQIPILGICLGYQILAHLYNANIHQMACGHHGINHPVKDLKTGRTMITSQNHEFVVDLKTLPNDLEPSHISLFDQSLEGFKVKNKPIIAVQFHPEASPGPHDAKHIFDDFLDLVAAYA
jgi:carbamoyl-phosphate synthase small subunit